MIACLFVLWFFLVCAPAILFSPSINEIPCHYLIMIISDQQQTDQHIEIKYVRPFVCLIVINLGRYVMAIAEKKTNTTTHIVYSIEFIITVPIIYGKLIYSSSEKKKKNSYHLYTIELWMENKSVNQNSCVSVCWSVGRSVGPFQFCTILSNRQWNYCATNGYMNRSVLFLHSFSPYVSMIFVKIKWTDCNLIWIQLIC